MSDKTITDIIQSALKECFYKHGVAITELSAEWMDVSTIEEKPYTSLVLSKVDIESHLKGEP